MPRVDAIANGLADEVRAERPAPEPVPIEELPLLAAVGVVRQRAVDLEVVAQQASSSPSNPQPAQAAARSATGRSAHWPVNSVTGRVIVLFRSSAGAGYASIRACQDTRATARSAVDRALCLVDGVPALRSRFRLEPWSMR